MGIFDRFAKFSSRDAEAVLAAVGKAQAIIEFTPDGHILAANPLFENVMGYTASELTGRHHALFMPPEDRDSEAYRAHWTRLAGGEAISGRFERRTKDGRVIWLQASYSPVTDGNGRVVRIVKLASDVSDFVERDAERTARLDAIDRKMATIAFDLDGRVLEANANFLAAIGYELREIVGQQHAMFVLPSERDSAAYRDFWSQLRAGQAQAGRFMRLGKGGRIIWIEATYNPVMGNDGKPIKVVKFATDITAQQAQAMDAQSQLAAIDKTQAVIEFKLDGTIVNANDNFLRGLGYTLSEVQGRHHRIFVPAEERESAAYASFWQRIAAGESFSGEFHRIAKDGSDVFIQASYNPILGVDGKPHKAIKYASDVTAQVKLLRNLRDLVGQVKVAAGAIGVSSSEIRSGNVDLAARTEAAAASLEETAASMEEITATVKHSSENAREASKIATAAADAGVRGTTVVTSVNATMEEIETSSRRIEDIISVIEGIAFQTNILALNAAVEAARAGEQGRGFAVVASEVRALSHRCSAAAKDVKTLIGASATSVRNGSARVAEASRAMVEVSGALTRVSELVREIAAASSEQASGIEQVNTAVVSLDQGTQQNAALVEEATAAAQSMDDQASQLVSMIASFIAANNLEAASTGSDAKERPPHRLRAVG